MKEFNTSIFIFRRDFRLEDNTSLIKALKNSDIVIPIFIFTPEQLDRKKNKYKSDNCVQFMMECLEDLDASLRKKKSRLFYFYDNPINVIKNIISKIDIDAIYVNMDYTPYSIKRDEKINDLCKEYDVIFKSYEDYLLQPINSVLTKQDTVYSKFTPFFNTAKKVKVNETTKNSFTNYFPEENKLQNEYLKDIHVFYKYNNQLTIKGGRQNTLKIFSNINKFKKYNMERNVLSINTTRLSAYIKFGCVSIREVYYKFKEKLGLNNDLVKQLYWREFYYNIGYAYPTVLSTNNFDKNFNKKYDRVTWITYDTATDKQKELYKKWTKGLTGFPAVDASMREMLVSGMMHNRGRLIVSSFLCKNLFWDWRDGEKFFSNYLYDYDPFVNNGNWQFMSGSGVDVQPYFRVLNPDLQLDKWDPDCVYVKKWIPELKNVPIEHIHNWEEYHKFHEDINYPIPMLGASLSSRQAIEKYKKGLYQ